MKEYLSNKNVDFTYVDITENIKNLREFLKIRDTSEIYKGIRGRSMVGIPMLKVEDEVVIGLQGEKLDEIIEKINTAD